MHNNLFINRLLIISTNGKIVYDEKFHKGVNIIRGANSSGKSTVSHFIFYVLGGAFNDWVKEAKYCSTVIAETEMNGATITMRRNLSFDENNKASTKEQIQFYWGKYEKAKSDVDNWLVFPYNTTSQKKSFSNVIFENLDIPIVMGENNITFHQILRLLYVDQESPTSSLFLFEKFDTTLTRETVAELLLGIYDQNLYTKKQELIELKKESDSLKDEIRVIKKFNQQQSKLDPTIVKGQIIRKEDEIIKIEGKIEAFEKKEKKPRFTKKSKLNFSKIKEETIKQRNVLNSLKDAINSLSVEILDTNYFISALENKIKAIKNSITTRNFLIKFPIEYCPECLSEIVQFNDDSKCSLCKNNVVESDSISKARKIEQEISFQIAESNQIVKRRERKLVEFKAEYEKEKNKYYELQRKVNQSVENVNSYKDEVITNLYENKGFVEGEIIQLRTFLENAEMYNLLLQKKSLIDQKIKTLEIRVQNIVAGQERLKNGINKIVESKGVSLLNNDLKRQDEFINATEFHIDYRNNIAYITDKEAKYSASSSFYLKVAARFALFFASLEIPKMRYPRFILCDNMEDKGIEKIRAQNFQELLITEAQTHDKEKYQMIYTTSFIPDKYNNSEYCVGDFYTEDNRSLNFS